MWNIQHKKRAQTTSQWISSASARCQVRRAFQAYTQALRKEAGREWLGQSGQSKESVTKCKGGWKEQRDGKGLSTYFHFAKSLIESDFVPGIDQYFANNFLQEESQLPSYQWCKWEVKKLVPQRQHHTPGPLRLWFKVILCYVASSWPDWVTWVPSHAKMKEESWVHGSRFLASIWGLWHMHALSLQQYF